MAPPVGPTVRVVGVVADGHYASLSDHVPVLFLPIAQQLGFYPAKPMQRIDLIGRSVTDNIAVRQLQAVVRDVDPEMATFDEGSLSKRLDDVLLPQRFGSWLLTTFGILSLIISGAGIYAVSAYEVARRQRELGIRAALGAQRWMLVRVVMQRSGIAIGIGVVIGLGGAFTAAQAVRVFLFNVAPTAPGSYIAAAAILTCLALLASFAPARRAGRTNVLTIVRDS